MRYGYKKEERYELRYISKKDGKEKSCYPKSKEKRDEQMAIAKEQGITVIYCKKLYPFSTNKNQHNFELVKNKCFNLMYDMTEGDTPYDEAEYDRLDALAKKAMGYSCYPLPVAWVPWEEHEEMKEISMLARNWRADTCIEHGRPDLVQYC